MSFNVEMIDSYAAAVAAVVGGLGVKILEKLMSKRSERFSEGAQLREELRTELESKRDEVDSLKKEVDEWRGKYYEQVEENLNITQAFETVRLETQRATHEKDESTEEKQ